MNVMYLMCFKEKADKYYGTALMLHDDVDELLNLFDCTLNNFHYNIESQNQFSSSIISWNCS